METRTSKVSIVGAGAVGATLAYAGLMRGFARTVALFDINTAKVEAEALDLAQGIQFMPEAKVIGSSQMSTCARIPTWWSSPQAPSSSRASRGCELAEATIGLMDKIIPPLIEVSPNAIYILVTNPVDVVTYAAIKASGMSRLADVRFRHRARLVALRHQVAVECDVAVLERPRLHRGRARRLRGGAVVVGDHRRRSASRLARRRRQRSS